MPYRFLIAAHAASSPTGPGSMREKTLAPKNKDPTRQGSLCAGVSSESIAKNR